MYTSPEQSDVQISSAGSPYPVHRSDKVGKIRYEKLTRRPLMVHLYTSNKVTTAWSRPRSRSREFTSVAGRGSRRRVPGPPPGLVASRPARPPDVAPREGARHAPANRVTPRTRSASTVPRSPRTRPSSCWRCWRTRSGSAAATRRGARCCTSRAAWVTARSPTPTPADEPQPPHEPSPQKTFPENRHAHYFVAPLESSAARAAENAAAANRRRVRAAVPRGRLVARRPGRATPQLPLVGLRGRQRHRAGSRAAPAVPLPQHRPGRARASRVAAHAPALSVARPPEPVAHAVGTLVPHGRLPRTDRQRVLVRRAAIGRRHAARHAGRNLDHPDAVGAHRPRSHAST